MFSLIQIMVYKITDLFVFQINGHTRTSYSATRLEKKKLLRI